MQTPLIRHLATTAALALAALVNGQEPGVPAPSATIQIIYTGGVPHLDRQGNILTQYDPERSFFPIAIWGVQMPGTQWDSEADWNVLTEAGFNTVWPWFTSQSCAGKRPNNSRCTSCTACGL